MTSVDLEKALKIALEATKIAGEEVTKVFYKSKVIETKNDDQVNLVTETDKKCENLITKYLKQNGGDYCFISEEFQADEELTEKPTWIIDPIDGTTNFVHGYPMVGISIALAIDKEVVLGVIHNPIIPGETYWAIKGKGAFRSGKAIHVSTETSLEKSLISSNFPYDRSKKTLNGLFEKFTKLLEVPIHGMRCCGSAVSSLIQVACGSQEVYFENGIQIWDIAAGKIIIEEAGGVVIDPCGGPIDITNHRVLAANNAKIAQEVAAILKSVEQSTGNQ